MLLRLKSAPVPADVRHPIILPSKSKVTERIVREIHSECGHAAPWRTLPELQRQFWLVGPRRVIRRVVESCVRCRRFAAKAATPRIADLPSSRLQVGEPSFHHTGVDYFGTVETKMFRRKVKRRGCLFRCLTTGACHLEMSYALYADAFLCCYGNFKATRGTPKVMRSDRGTNFIGANRELREAIERMDNEKIRGRLAEDGTEWIVNPPATPHQGGIWERPIQTAKRALVKVLHGQEFTDQSLSCALTQVEFLQNSRPLTYISTDPSATETLTPFHLLLGRANPHLPPDVFHTSDWSHRKKWRVAHAVAEHFWRRWMAEHMPTLTERKKWVDDFRQLCVGDVVIVIDDQTPRGQWPLGLVTTVFPGPDGIVHSAMVRHRGTELHRPAVKLALLLPDEEADVAAEEVADVESSAADSDADCTEDVIAAQSQGRQCDESSGKKRLRIVVPLPRFERYVGRGD